MSLNRQSAAYQAFVQRLRREDRLRLAVQLGILVLFLVLWEISARQAWVDPLLTSSPWRVAATLAKMTASGSLFQHVGVSLKETLFSLVIGMGLGVLVATILWWSPFVSRVLDPYLVVLNAMPKIALGPIFYIWMGDRLSVYGLAITISVVVAILMMYTGFRSVDQEKIKLVRTFGAGRLQVLTKVVFPGTMPTLVATAKVNVGLTLVGVVVGEFLSAKAGLGYLIIYGGQVFQMELVMTSIVLLAVLSALLYGLVHWGERKLGRRAV